MTKIEKITTLLNPHYFWDVDTSNQVSARLVVERVFNFGTLAEVSLVMDFYGRSEVEKILLSLNYLDPKTLNFVSKFFNKPKRSFKCYTRRRLKTQHWDY
jgi:hypothetical protein